MTDSQPHPRAAAPTTRARAQQITKAEHTRDLARRYADGLRAALSGLIADVDTAEQAAAAAKAIAEDMARFDNFTSGWFDPDDARLELAPDDRRDLVEDLRRIRGRLRRLRRIGEYHLDRADTDRAVDWLIPTSDTPSGQPDDRRDEIIRALPAWHRKHPPRDKGPRAWATHNPTYQALAHVTDTPPSAPAVNGDGGGDSAVTAYVHALSRSYTALRARAADIVRGAVLIEHDTDAILRYDLGLGLGIEPDDDDRMDLLFGAGIVDYAHNLFRIVDGYYRVFDSGRGAKVLTQPSTDGDQERSRRGRLERIARWHHHQDHQQPDGDHA